MRHLIAVLALALTIVASQTAVAQIESTVGSTGFSATYDPATGGIIFNNYGGLLGIKLQSASGTLVPGATDLNGDAGGFLGVVNESEIPLFIEWGNLAGFPANSNFGGNVITPNTSPTDLSVEVAVTPTQFETVNFVPEPASAALIGLGLCGLAARRRR